jgi:hypothetical protein
LDNLFPLEFVNALHLHLQLFVLSVLLLRQMDDPATNTQTMTTTDATSIMLWFFVNSKLKSFIARCVKSS